MRRAHLLILTSVCLLASVPSVHAGASGLVWRKVSLACSPIKFEKWDSDPANLVKLVGAMLGGKVENGKIKNFDVEIKAGGDESTIELRDTMSTPRRFVHIGICSISARFDKACIIRFDVRGNVEDGRAGPEDKEEVANWVLKLVDQGLPLLDKELGLRANGKANGKKL
jgi:hypothetical protein